MMQPLATLGTLMGLAFTSGIGLYATVFAAGLGIRFGFIQIPDALAHLQVLATTPILIVSGVAYVAEFVADKIPWFDSVWDAFHTFIRPLGAAVLGAVAIGAVDPVWKFGAFLLCGSIALTSHSAKAGSRLAANHSPEPLSNIGLSLGEDAVVLGGTWLAFAYPVLAFVVVVIAVALILWMLPKLFRIFRRNFGRLSAFVRGRPVQDSRTQS